MGFNSSCLLAWIGYCRATAILGTFYRHRFCQGEFASVALAMIWCSVVFAGAVAGGPILWWLTLYSLLYFIRVASQFSWAWFYRVCRTYFNPLVAGILAAFWLLFELLFATYHSLFAQRSWPKDIIRLSVIREANATKLCGTFGYLCGPVSAILWHILVWDRIVVNLRCYLCGGWVLGGVVLFCRSHSCRRLINQVLAGMMLMLARLMEAFWWFGCMKCCSGFHLFASIAIYGEPCYGSLNRELLTTYDVVTSFTHWELSLKLF